MKKCFKCNTEKPLDDFYRHPKMPDGHVNKCKDCNKKDVSENYIKNVSLTEGYVDKERKRGRNKYHRLYHGTVKSYKKRIVTYYEKYPEKYASKKYCSKIKSPIGYEKHHWSYNIEDAKDVIFLTKKEHSKAHRFIVYDQERMMYRRFDTNELLNTKEVHFDFINFCILNYED